ncbi:hypothetical protein E3N88_14271 [Mikania micrantha]|uniref:Uncharacterized protein n=1 Tax=Mikania micrantha TaxID=192012 RepID=A0A5N6P2N8_9ASTR|nr:hypothetical protein E3N88_14271 [Mikania micrantha]
MVSHVIATFMMIESLKDERYNAYAVVVPSANELLQNFKLAAPVFMMMMSKAQQSSSDTALLAATNGSTNSTSSSNRSTSQPHVFPGNRDFNDSHQYIPGRGQSDSLQRGRGGRGRGCGCSKGRASSAGQNYYPQKPWGYKCYDLSTHKIILSRHILFDEHVFPFAKIHLSTPSYDFLNSFPNNSFHPSFWDSVSSSPTSEQPPLAHTEPVPMAQNAPANTAPLAHTETSSMDQTDTTHSAPMAQTTPAHTSPMTPTEPTQTAPPAHQQPVTFPQVYTRRAKQATPSPPSPPPPPPPPPPPLRTIVTRSMTGHTKPKHPLNLHSTTSFEPIPRNSVEAFTIPVWYRAMTDEFNALIDNNTWELVPRHPNMNLIRCMWIFKHKTKSDGSLERYKARLVCDGRSQQVGVDCHETFSPVVKPATIRTVLSIALLHGWDINQLDVKNAFLHGTLNETIYMHQPLGFRDSSFPHHVCKLKKSLYGLKQAPWAWYQRFTDFVTTLGFRHSSCDHSLFIYKKGSDTAYMLLYVDDIILTSSSSQLKQQFLTKLSSEFAMKDLGSLTYFLGISVTRDTNGMFLSQHLYAQDILQRAKMADCNPVHTPVDTAGKLGANAGDLLSDPTSYRSLAGALQYLTFTRPDISYAVQQVCMHMHAPRSGHLNDLKRIFRYIKGTLTMGVYMRRNPITSLISYTDADWAGCPDTRRSTSGYCVFLGDNLISWSSKRQTVTLLYFRFSSSSLNGIARSWCPRVRVIKENENPRRNYQIGRHLEFYFENPKPHMGERMRAMDELITRNDAKEMMMMSCGSRPRWIDRTFMGAGPREPNPSSEPVSRTCAHSTRNTDSKEFRCPRAFEQSTHPSWHPDVSAIGRGVTQTTISRSSAEAEYRGVANVVAELCWIRNLLLELGCPTQRASLVYCDNVSAIYMSGNPIQHQRTKHIEIDIHFVRDKVRTGHIHVLHVPSRFQFADIFTKGLPHALFIDFRSSLSIRDPPP